MKEKIVASVWVCLFFLGGILSPALGWAGTAGVSLENVKLKKMQNSSRRLSSELIRMNEKARSKATKGVSASEMQSMEPWIRHVDGLPELEICLNTTDAQAVQDARDWLVALKMTVTSMSQRYGRIYGILDLSLLAELEQTPYLAQVHPNYLPLVRFGSVDSEGDAAMVTQAIRDSYGIDGSGVTVGVISDSFDAAGGGVDSSITNGDLPGALNPNGYGTEVTVLADDATGADEGRAMAEIVHDVAPGATLVFHAAFLGGKAGLAEAFTTLQEYGADIIVDDVAYLSEAYYQDGIIAQAAREAADAGVLLFSSSGNAADRGLEMIYEDIDPIREDTLLGMGYDFHDFGQKVPYTELTVAPGHFFRASLWWSEPYDGTLGPGASQDLDFYLFDADSGKLVYGSDTSQGCSLDEGVGGDPFELVAYQNLTEETVTLRMVVDRICGSGDDLNIKIMIFGTSGVELDPALFNSATVYGHPAAQGVIAVGAVYALDTDAFNDPPNEPVPVEYFTSLGDNLRFFFDENGHDLANAPVIRSKPEIAAPDGVSTSTAGFETFYGTSAAAPHAGALAALLFEAMPGESAVFISDCMRAGAIDVADTGRDGYSGNGLVNGPNTMAILLAGGEGVYAIDAGSGSHGSVHPSGRMIGYTPGAGDTVAAHDQMFTFTPETHFHVDDVLVNGESRGAMPSYTFSGETEDQTLYVEFAADTFTITATTGTGGSIRPSGAVATVFADNRVFTMEADTGYTLTDVQVDGLSVGAVGTYAFSDTVTDHAIEASFTLNTYTVTALVDGTGTLSPSVEQTVDHGSSLVFTATAGEGRHIAEILINGESSGGEGQASYALFLSHIVEDTEVSAVFEPDTFTVTLAEGDHVSFDPSGSQEVAYGGNLTVAMILDDTYRIIEVRVDGEPVDAEGSYTFENVTADHTLSVDVAKNGGGGGCFISSMKGDD